MAKFVTRTVKYIKMKWNTPKGIIDVAIPYQTRFIKDISILARKVTSMYGVGFPTDVEVVSETRRVEEAKFIEISTLVENEEN